MQMAHFLRRPARRVPDKTALVSGPEARTFGEVDERSDRLAAAFAALGLGPGDRLALLMGNRMEFVETEVAAMKAGLVKVPINPRLHPREYVFMLADCGAAAAACDPGFIEDLRAHRADVPALKHLVVVGEPADDLHGYEALITSHWPAPPRVEFDDDAAFLIRYTGGTTGRPKGIVHTHRAFQAITLDVVRELGLTERDVVLVVGHLSHGNNFMWAPFFAVGATQVILERFDPRAALEAIQRHRVTFTYMVPTMVQALLNEPIEAYDCSSLETFLYASAPMPVETLKAAIRRLGPIFTQVYTLSESPVITTILHKHEHLLDGPEPVVRRLASCGREALNVRVRVVTEAGEDVAVGQVGEIVARTPCNMKEYWNLPDATARTLRDGWVHTGDLATVDEAGYIYLVDRKHDMIISGGFNIYPREVEEVLYLHPAVQEAAVIGVPDDTWGEAVKAIVALKPDTSATANDLVELCLTHLARYKRPKSIEFVEALPKSAVGKILRRELREPYWRGHDRRVH
ncbi:MAG: class I adenylate-forming enzyme family protein [Candidatus Rokuibacteriota bacterium]